MSEDLQKALNTALARIAALESRPAPQPQAPAFDAQAFTADPMGTMKRLGLPVDHITRVVIANAMGDQAPPELRALAAMGPQVSATQALAAQLQTMSQRLEQFESGARSQAARQGFGALAADKSKYPLLAAAYARDPSLFDGDVDAHRGDAAALADNLEKRLAVLAPALGAPPPASTESAGTPSTEGQQVQAQVTSGRGSSAGTDNTPPPLPSVAPRGVFTQSDHEQLKARILKQYNAQPKPTYR